HAFLPRYLEGSLQEKIQSPGDGDVEDVIRMEVAQQQRHEPGPGGMPALSGALRLQQQAEDADDGARGDGEQRGAVDREVGERLRLPAVRRRLLHPRVAAE